MSPTWYIIKCLAMTFAIVSVLQIRVGSEAKTLEVYFLNWMKSLSASKRIQDVAYGGKELTTDFIREFTTPDGRKIYIRETIQPNTRDQASKSKAESLVDSNLVQRLISGIKLDINDLNADSQNSIKDKLKKDMELEIRKDYEARLRGAGIDPKTLDAKN